MKKKYVFFIFLLFVFGYSTRVNINQKFYIDYSIIGSTFNMTIAAQTEGYVSIGFGSSMLNCQAIIGYSNKNAEDRTCVGYKPPSLDLTQEITYSSQNFVNGWTIVNITRPIKKNGQNLISLNQQQPIIWAYGGSNSLTKHANGAYGVFQAVFQENQNCYSTCNTCQGSLSNQCLTCKQGYELQNSNCIPINCATNCLSCFGSQNNQCSSCTQNYYLRNYQCVQADVSLPNSYWNIKNDVIQVYFEILNDQSVDFLFKFPANHYFGLSLGSLKMQNADMIIAVTGKDTVYVDDYYSFSYKVPSLDVSIGGTSDVVVKGQKIENGIAYIKFNRKMNTQDSKDYILKEGVNDFNYAYFATNSIAYHELKRKSFRAELKNGVKGNIEIVDTNLDTSLKSHGLGLIILWSCIADIGIMFTRFLRSKNYYLNAHAFIFSIVDFGSIILVLVMFAPFEEFWSSRLDNASIFQAHFAMGLIAFIFIFIQHVVGALIYLKIKSIKPNSKISKMRFLHQIQGYSILIFGKIAIILGSVSVKDDNDNTYGFQNVGTILLIIFFVLRIFFEFLYLIKPKFLSFPIRGNYILKKRPEYNTIISKLNAGVPIAELVEMYPKLSFVFYQNNLYDLTDFQHSGGQFIINQVRGRDIDRFIIGAYGLESENIEPHLHTIYALKALEKRFVAKVNRKTQEIVKSKIEGKNLLDNGTIDIQIELVNKTKLASNIHKYDFCNSNIQAQNYLNDVDWIGYHYTITPIKGSLKKTRLYTVITSMHSESMQYRNILLSLYNQEFNTSSQAENKEIGNLIESLKDLKSKEHSDKISLIIKTYNFPNTLSQFLETSNHKEYNLKGPYGEGLGISKKSNGTYVIFAGGTGILPFMDLLDYLLKKAIFMTLQKKMDISQILPKNENFVEAFGENFCLIVYAAFDSEEDILGKDILIKLHEITKEQKLTFFKLNLKLKTGSQILPTIKQRFEGELISNLLKTEIKNIQKVYVCGPPIMNKNVPFQLLQAGLEAKKIFLV